MTAKTAGAQRLGDFPAVYISYDEPWADAGFAALAEVWPNAHHVQGVKGLNACHVAAAEAAQSAWFLTVDADTEVTPSAPDADVPAHLLTPKFRLDWQSRNAVNSVVSGNGSLKLWPRDLVLAMRSHEAAEPNAVSLDADISGIEPGVTQSVLMPGCHSVCDPARTAAHAFRAGFREAAFLSWLARRYGDGGDGGVAQVLAIWCTIGAHRAGGDWLIYGARLGYWADRAWPGWDIRCIHDYPWLDRLWSGQVVPRIGPGGATCKASGLRYDADRLAEDTRALGADLARLGLPALADLTAPESAMMAAGAAFPAMRAGKTLNILGRALELGRGVARDLDAAGDAFAEGAVLGNSTAMTNLGRLHLRGQIAGADRKKAEALFRQAVAGGCAYAPHQLAECLAQAGGADPTEIERLRDLSAERGFAPKTVPA